MATPDRPPYRFFGPLDSKDAADLLVERLLDHPGMKETLIDFCTGWIEPRELCYEIQIMLENEEKQNKDVP